NLAGVDGGEEIAADGENQQTREHNQRHESDDNPGAIFEGPGEETAIDAAEFFKLDIKSAVNTPDEVQAADKPDDCRYHDQAHQRFGQPEPVSEYPATGEGNGKSCHDDGGNDGHQNNRNDFFNDAQVSFFL